MNGPVGGMRSNPAGAIPVEFEALSTSPQLLPGENPERYDALRTTIFLDLAPQSAVEWLLAIDIVEACWELQRYRYLRQKLFEVYRQKAIEVSLRRIDAAGVAPAFKGEAELQTARNALDWRLDRAATDEIDGRLARYGFDRLTISMEVHVQARESFALFEALINAAQLRRLLLLKEMNNLRRLPMVRGRLR